MALYSQSDWLKSIPKIPAVVPSSATAVPVVGTGGISPILRSIIAKKGSWKMASREWKTGFMEMNRSIRKGLFVRDLQKMIPEIKSSDLGGGGSGVRAQAVDGSGRLLDDFVIEYTEGSIHVLNAPSPGATSSLVIGKRITDLAEEAFSLN